MRVSVYALWLQKPHFHVFISIIPYFFCVRFLDFALSNLIWSKFHFQWKRQYNNLWNERTTCVQTSKQAIEKYGGKNVNSISTGTYTLTKWMCNGNGKRNIIIIATTKQQSIIWNNRHSWVCVCVRIHRNAHVHSYVIISTFNISPKNTHTLTHMCRDRQRWTRSSAEAYYTHSENIYLIYTSEISLFRFRFHFQLRLFAVLLLLAATRFSFASTR